MQLDTLLHCLKAAGETSRLRLLAILSRNELTVTELTRVLAQSQPRVSRHLKVLCDAGLLDRFQEGSWVFYRAVSDESRGPLLKAILSHLDYEDPAFQEELRRLEQVKAQHTATAREYFAAQADAWDNIRSLHVDESAVEQAVVAALADIRPEHLLDIGTGTGRMLELFAAQVNKGTGVDLSHEMLAIARARLRHLGHQHCHVRHGDVYSLPIPNQSVDAVVIHHVLHFLDDPRSAIEEAARCLQHEGRIVIVDFAPHSLEFLRSGYAHRRLGFEQRQVNHWLKEAGIGQLRVQYLEAERSDIEDTLTVTIWTGVQQRKSIQQPTDASESQNDSLFLDGFDSRVA